MVNKKPRRRAQQIFGFLLLSAVLPVSACQSKLEGTVTVTTAEEAVVLAKKAWKSIYEKASWNSIYSKQSTDKFEPYTATLEGDVWVVRGTIPEGFHGETLETSVCRTDGSTFAKGVKK